MDNIDKLMAIFESDSDGLLDKLPSQSRLREDDQRLLEGFQEIMAFQKEHSRLPQVNKGMAERRLATRFTSILSDPVKCSLLAPYDVDGLLRTSNPPPATLSEVIDNDDLNLLGGGANEIFTLKHVKKETTMPEYVASRKPCEDFEKFKQLFIKCQQELKHGNRTLLPFANEQQIFKGRFYVLKGILLYVADIGKKKTDKGKRNARLRCIFENETESDMMLRSLAAELYKDGRRVTEDGDILVDELSQISSEDTEVGHIYILRSKSDQPEIKSINNLFKIGFSTTSIDERIKNAHNDPTYLMAPVQLITSFKCYNLNPQKLEALLHRFFGSSTLSIDVTTSGGQRYNPREWFIAPLSVIEAAVKLIADGSIVNYRYNAVSESIEAL